MAVVANFRKGLLTLGLSLAGLGVVLVPAEILAADLTVLTGTSVTLDATSTQGSPTAYEWYITPPGQAPPTAPTASQPTLTLPVDAYGEWTVDLLVRYAHLVDGFPYQSAMSRTIVARSVVADVAPQSGPRPSDAFITLNGSASQVAAGVQPDISWSVAGPIHYLGCPSDLLCTIPPNSLVPGTYTVALTLHDPASGDTDIDSAVLTVIESGVSTDFTWLGSPSESLSISFSATLSSTYALISSATWDFGDGTQRTIACIRLSDCSSPTHVYAQEGVHRVTLTAFDLDGHSGLVRHTVATGGVIHWDDFESGTPTGWSNVRAR